MDFVLINRIGIVLNFLAGFMLAPELLGVERLRKAENSIESLSDNVSKYLLRISDAMKDYMIGKLKIALLILVIVCGYLFASILGALVVKKLEPIKGTGVFLVFAFFIVTLVLVIYQIKTDPLVLLAPIVGPFWMIFVLVSTLLSVLFLLVIGFFSMVVTYVRQKMEGEGRLRSILVLWGIIFFIVGNALQFAATFDSP